MSKGKREMLKREGCLRFTQVDNWLLLSRGMLFVQMLMVLGSERDDELFFQLILFVSMLMVFIQTGATLGMCQSKRGSREDLLIWSVRLNRVLFTAHKWFE
jgi:hypothetical protein